MIVQTNAINTDYAAHRWAKMTRAQRRRLMFWFSLLPPVLCAVVWAGTLIWSVSIYVEPGDAFVDISDNSIEIDWGFGARPTPSFIEIDRVSSWPRLAVPNIVGFGTRSGGIVVPCWLLLLLTVPFPVIAWRRWRRDA